MDRRRVADRAEAELEVVVHLVDLHPVTEDTFAGSWVDGRPLVGPPAECPLAGVGTPQVDEDVVAALGAALGVFYRTALALVGESLELCYRLPRLWALVQDGCLQAWKARQVARHTMDLSEAAAAFVDAHLAVTGTRNRIPATLDHLVAQALLRCDRTPPETANTPRRRPVRSPSTTATPPPPPC